MKKKILIPTISIILLVSIAIFGYWFTSTEWVTIKLPYFIADGVPVSTFTPHIDILQADIVNSLVPGTYIQLDNNVVNVLIKDEEKTKMKYLPNDLISCYSAPLYLNDAIIKIQIHSRDYDRLKNFMISAFQANIDDKKRYMDSKIIITSIGNPITGELLYQGYSLGPDLITTLSDLNNVIKEAIDMSEKDFIKNNPDFVQFTHGLVKDVDSNDVTAKAAVFYNWVSNRDNLAYDDSLKNLLSEEYAKKSCVSYVWKNRICNCVGNAFLLKAMFDLEGIRNTIIYGNAPELGEDSGHAITAYYLNANSTEPTYPPLIDENNKYVDFFESESFDIETLRAYDSTK